MTTPLRATGPVPWPPLAILSAAITIPALAYVAGVGRTPPWQGFVTGGVLTAAIVLAPLLAPPSALLAWLWLAGVGEAGELALAAVAAVLVILARQARDRRLAAITCGYALAVAVIAWPALWSLPTALQVGTSIHYQDLVALSLPPMLGPPVLALLPGAMLLSAAAYLLIRNRHLADETVAG